MRTPPSTRNSPAQATAIRARTLLRRGLRGAGAPVMTAGTRRL